MEPIGPINEDDLVPISALQHFLFCERQCALIHIEQIWGENRLTAEGKLLHDRTHEAGNESRGDVRLARGLRLRSLKYGLSGQADLVEFHKQNDGSWRPYPVEYKHGKLKIIDCDRVQLCAQAVCLEEMLNTDVPEGAIYYGQPKKREIVCLSSVLRDTLASAVSGLHRLISSNLTPLAKYDKKCEACSLVDLCQPRLPKSHDAVEKYLERELKHL